MTWSIPEGVIPVSGLAPQVGGAAAVTGDYISLKNAVKAWILIHYVQGDATDITWHVNRATAVAPTGATALANAVPIYSNLACATSNTMVKRTAAVNYASGTGQATKLIVFEIDPASLGSTYDCVAGASTTAIAATSAVSMTYLILPRYSNLDLDFIAD